MCGGSRREREVLKQNADYQMKRSFLRSIGVLMALLFTLAVCPSVGAFIEATPSWTVPSGYDTTEYNRIATFLELTDENGVKNGTKCGTNYTPNDPTTWGKEGYYNTPDDYIRPTTFTWSEYDGKKYITEITCYANDCVGALNLSGFSHIVSLNTARNRISSLNLSQCTALSSVICSSNRLTSLNVSSLSSLASLTADNNSISSIGLSSNTALRSLSIGNNPISSLSLSANTNLYMLSCSGCDLSSLNVSALTRLQSLYCANNHISSLNVSSCPQIKYLNCAGNNLSSLNVSAQTMLLGLNCANNNIASLDLSSATMLIYLSCVGNRLTSLDLSQTRLGIGTVTAASGGTIGVSVSLSSAGTDEMPSLNNTVCAAPNSGYTFSGWYTPGGAFISNSAELSLADTTETSFNARFTAGSAQQPGDVNNDGSVNALDAILVLRYSLNSSSLTPAQLAAADVNGDGSVNALDAILILRRAMGLVSGF